MKLNKTELREVCYEDHEDFETVSEGDWTQEHKYQYRDIVVKHLPTNKFFSFYIHRSGSYHTDWYYSYDDEGAELTEVHKVSRTVTVEEWEPVDGNT